MNPATQGIKQRVLEVVKTIPPGKVMYFGQIGDIVGAHARTVGFIMTGLSQDEMKDIPWYRVVAKNGFVSSLKLGEKGLVQKEILLKEGYTIEKDHVSMPSHLWE